MPRFFLLPALLALALASATASADDQSPQPGDLLLRTNYEPAVCGDALMQDYETCDVGPPVEGDACGDDCRAEHGYWCYGSPSVCSTFCGDGYVAGDEECDDGSPRDHDGCSAACTVEPGAICQGEPSTCTIECGDGITAGKEQCDDGGTAGGDGCSATCAIEPGFSCSGTPSVCTSNCGDGLVDGAEECDDGGNVDLDGCSSTCAAEPGYACTGEPSVCQVPNCEAIEPPAGRTRAAIPRSWAQLTGDPQFAGMNVYSPLRLVPGSTLANLTFLGHGANEWVSIPFTTTTGSFSGSLSFGPTQIPGTSGGANGSYVLTVTRCPADFRVGIAEPQESTDGLACRNYFKGSSGYIPIQAIYYDSSGVLGDRVTNNTCGLQPNHTYFLNYGNNSATCPNGSPCGVQFRSN